jgi:hypothetical protein
MQRAVARRRPVAACGVAAEVDVEDDCRHAATIAHRRPKNNELNQLVRLIAEHCIRPRLMRQTHGWCGTHRGMRPSRLTERSNFSGRWRCPVAEAWFASGYSGPQSLTAFPKSASRLAVSSSRSTM